MNPFGSQMAPKRKSEQSGKGKKLTALAFFKEQLTSAYQEKYGGVYAKSTLNAIMANDFKLDGVKELFSHMKPVDGFQLPDYTKDQLFTLEMKGFAPALNRNQPGRVSKETLAHVEKPICFNKSLWEVVDDEEAERAVKKPKMKPHKRALFDLVKGYKEGVTDKAKTNEKAVALIKEDPDCVKRKFWDASLEYQYIGGEHYDDEEGTFSDEIEGVATPLWIASGKCKMFLCSTSITCSLSSSSSSGQGLNEIVKLLIEEHGADPNEQWGIDCCSVTAMHNAIVDGHLDCVRVLHENGVDIKDSYCINDGNMATVAALSGNVDLLKFLTGVGVGPVDSARFQQMSKLRWDFDRSRALEPKVTNPLMTTAIEENQATVPK